MFPGLFILGSKTTAASDAAVGKFARFLGIEPRPIQSGEQMDSSETTPVLAVHCRTLKQLRANGGIENILKKAAFAFVYGFAASEKPDEELAWLTGGELETVTSLPAYGRKVTVHGPGEFGGFAVCGQSYKAIDSFPAVFMSAQSAGKIDAHITVANHLYLASVMKDACRVFVMAETELLDIEWPITPEIPLRTWYPQLIAMSIFLRGIFKQACWSAPVTPATFIVDDPKLQKRYGFIRYEELMGELEKTGAALNIAFIPFNHAASDPATVDLVLKHPDQFSISVHGCDHTAGEYASLDDAWLAGMTACARERMEAHERKYGMPFDNVLVFPQGKFSSKAIHALKTCGFDAAVNSGAWPVDHEGTVVTVQDVLSVAVTTYEKFPIFVRRYPEDIFDHAFDLLFQRPVLAVEHHEYFRHGYEAFADYVSALSSLKGGVQWMPLGKAVANSCVVRRSGAGELALRHFARVLQFKNPTGTNISLLVEKPEQDGVVASVLVNGRETPFKIESGMLRYQTSLKADAEISVEINYRPVVRVGFKRGLRYRMRAATRRMLSDLRDNHLSRHEKLLAFARRLKNGGGS